MLFATFTCAACGLVYELALITLGSYLVGNSVQQASLVLSVMVFAMGVGALTAKPLARSPVVAFAAIEGLLALVGGLSVLALYAAFAWLDLYQPALLVVSFVVGALIGAEIPVLMTLLQRIRQQEAGDAVADLFAADYVGALLGGLAFPFLLLPLLGQVRGALVVGAVNVVTAGLVARWVFRRALCRRQRLGIDVVLVGVLAALVTAGLLAPGFEVSARQALYEDPIVSSERSRYQDIVVTESVSLGRRPDVRLFLNGDLQFSSVDEYRYHESLVHPAMAGAHRSVLVLGGGDGLALREVLRYPDVERVVLVELDPSMLALARDDPRLVELNGASMADPRVEVVAADAFGWLRQQGERFDAVIVDLPDPEDTATAKLYSAEFYSLIGHALAPAGRLAVQAGSPYFAADAFWCVEQTVRAGGFTTTPYHADVPSFGDWGFVLASASASAEGPPPALRLHDPAPQGLRYLDDQVLAAADVFPKDRQRRTVRPSTLVHPTILDYQRAGWQDS